MASVLPILIAPLLSWIWAWSESSGWGRSIASRPARVRLGRSRRALDRVGHLLLEGLGARRWVLVELVQSLDAHPQRVVTLAPDCGFDIRDLLRGDGLALASERNAVVPVLGDDRDDGLACHVSAADQHVGFVELRRVEKLLPAHLGAVEVGREKDLRH